MTKPLCRPHYFVLPPPNGPVSIGACEKCGQTKRFRNSPAEISTRQWNNASLFGRGPADSFHREEETFKVDPEILMRE